MELKKDNLWCGGVVQVASARNVINLPKQSDFIQPVQPVAKREYKKKNQVYWESKKKYGKTKKTKKENCSILHLPNDNENTKLDTTVSEQLSEFMQLTGIFFSF